MCWRAASQKERGQGFVLQCLLHPSPNDPKAPPFPSIACFICWKHHKASFISLALWQFSFSKCKCYIWKRQESSLLPESLLLSPVLCSTPASCDHSLQHNTLLKGFEAFSSAAECLPQLQAPAHLESPLRSGAAGQPSAEQLRDIPLPGTRRAADTDEHQNDNNADEQKLICQGWQEEQLVSWCGLRSSAAGGSSSPQGMTLMHHEHC